MAEKVIHAAMRNCVLNTCGELSELLIEEMNKNKKKRCWVRKWLSRREIYGASSTLLKELAAGDVSEYRNWLRMTKERFKILLAQIAPKITKNNTVMRSAIPARIKLEITLSYLATGNSYRTLQRLFRVSRAAISNFVPGVCDGIYENLQEYIKVPESQEEWNLIEKEFRLKCYGAIDGKHVTIHAPANSGSEFFNYKGYNSIILLAVVDDDYCFRYINVGSPGRQSDGGVFQQSSLFEAPENGLLPDGGFIVGDDAFPLKMYLMKPYSKIALSEEQKICNYRLSRARRIVENAFGILVSRFRIFEKPIACLPETVDKIIKACWAIHNYLRITSHNTYTPNGSVDQEDIESGHIRLGSWRNEANAPLPSIRTLGSNHSPRLARNCETESASSLWEEVRSHGSNG